MKHAVPEELYTHQREQLRDGLVQRSIYCPLGHEWIHKGEGRAALLERQLQSERQRHDQTKASLRDERNKLNTEKSAKARIKNRVGNGVCPCCNRTFVELGRHMKTKHPDYAKGAAREA
jgi:hypothetical protein